jgi:ketosteroid isomerase-like protein
MDLMRHEDVRRWVAGYEKVWRSPGTARLAELFTEDVSYRPSPWEEPVEGMEDLAKFWNAERDGPGEAFTMSSELVALDGGTAVVRTQVDYEKSSSGRWRDLWVLRFDADGRCRHFEEWPFAPGQPDGH